MKSKQSAEGMWTTYPTELGEETSLNRTLTLYVIKPFNPWGSTLCTCPPKYSLHPYTGCSHRCLYCYATSYIGLKYSTPKSNYLRRLQYDIKRVNPKLPINMSTSSDPYPPEELQYRLTRKTLEILIPLGFKILITTKNTIFLRDLSILAKGNVAITLTLTTLDENLASKIEPNTPKPKDRLKAIEKAIQHGIPVGVRLDPIIPYLNDDPVEIRELIDTVSSIGVKFIVTSTYKVRPDNFKRMIAAFPEIEYRWRRLYYIDGEYRDNYRYLPLNMRMKLLKIVIDCARRSKLSYATCREGLTSKEWFNAKSCDGTHLIPLKIKPTIHKYNMRKLSQYSN